MILSVNAIAQYSQSIHYTTAYGEEVNIRRRITTEQSNKEGGLYKTVGGYCTGGQTRSVQTQLQYLQSQVDPIFSCVRNTGTEF